VRGVDKLELIVSAKESIIFREVGKLVGAVRRNLRFKNPGVRPVKVEEHKTAYLSDAFQNEVRQLGGKWTCDRHAQLILSGAPEYGRKAFFGKLQNDITLVNVQKVRFAGIEIRKISSAEDCLLELGRDDRTDNGVFRIVFAEINEEDFVLIDEIGYVELSGGIAKDGLQHNGIRNLGHPDEDCRDAVRLDFDMRWEIIASIGMAVKKYLLHPLLVLDKARYVKKCTGPIELGMVARIRLKESPDDPPKIISAYRGRRKVDDVCDVV